MGMAISFVGNRTCVLPDVMAILPLGLVMDVSSPERDCAIFAKASDSTHTSRACPWDDTTGMVAVVYTFPWFRVSMSRSRSLSRPSFTYRQYSSCPEEA